MMPTLEYAAAPPPAARAADGRLVVSVRRNMDWTADELASLDAIVDARPHLGVFLTKPWLSGLLAAPSPDGEPSILVFHQHGALRGLVPLAITDTWAGMEVSLLGGAFRSDRIDLLADRGYEPRLAEQFLEWLSELGGRRGFVLKLRDVPGDSPLWGAIRRTIDEGKAPFVLVPREVHTLPYLPIEERDAGSLEDRTTRDTSQRRQWAMLGRRGALKIDLLDDAQDVMRAFDVLTQLLRARWGAGRSVLDDARTRLFHHSVLPELLSEGRVRMILMRSGLRPVGVCYSFAGGARLADRGRSWWGYYLSGYDREWAGRIHLGRLIVATAIDLAARERAQEFDLLKGAERYKYFWPVRERVTVDADLISGTSRTQVRRASVAARHAAVSLVKAMRALLSSPSQRTQESTAP
jgi:CelD/BcsL family acetyltransferase involved in cellulose biosynthesis